MTSKSLCLALGVVGALTTAACDLDVPDLNSPGLGELEETPTAISINTAATGLLIGNRAGKAPTAGYVNQLGILGRESYDFDPADGRFVTELIQGNLNRASPFGGTAAVWAQPYANIRLANILLRGVAKVPEFDAETQAGLRGFAHTSQALDLLTIIVTHDATGAVIDTDRPLGAQLAPFVGRDAVYTEIARLLDAARDELAAAGSSAFSFPLSPGFTGFNKPSTFLKYNRALRARVAVYQKDYATALTALAASFLDDTSATIDFKLGVSYAYSLATGDAANALNNQNIYAHPSILADAQKQADGTTLDARYTAKVDTLASPITSSTDSSLSTTIKFKIFTNTTPIPVIRNEDLILLKAEALWFTGDHPGATAALNVVRTKSGKLPALAEPAGDAAFLDALLYERRYSLMFEGGHRWIDLRRHGRDLPVDNASHVRNVRFPIPQAECDARPGEPACAINSSDPAP